MRVRFFGWIAAGLVLALTACASAASQVSQPSTSVKIPILVTQDQVFGYVQKAQIGTATFSSTQGIVGSRIRMHISLNDITRFLGNVLSGSITVINTNLIRDPDYEMDFTIDTNASAPIVDFQFYIPQVLTMPANVDFQMNLSFDTEDVHHNPISFVAGLVFEFNVNSGHPAS